MTSTPPGWQGMWEVTNVPFLHGTVGYRERTHVEAHIPIVQELADALEIGYVRFLDFQRLEEQNAQIREANQLKSDFLARMSHDLRTPMNAISGYVNILRRKTRDVLEERQYRNLENIQQSADNMLHLIDYIQDLSKIAAEAPEITVQEVDCRELIGECVETVSASIRPGVQIRADADGVMSISTDPDRVKRVLTDVLDNALKFTESGEIVVSLKAIDDRLEISVTDTGVGISGDDLPFIFDEFYQVARKKGMPQDGSGLSMARAKKSIELLGGIIFAESEPGRGTTFTIRLDDYKAAL